MKIMITIIILTFTAEGGLVRSTNSGDDVRSIAPDCLCSIYTVK